MLSTLLGFAAGGDGPTLLPAPTSVQTLPTAAPPVQSNASATLSLVGVDIVPFTFGLTGPAPAGSQIVTFPNLPYRYNTQNALQPTVTAAQQPITIAPTNLLLFFAFIMGLSAPSGTVDSISTQAINTKNVYIPGPILGSDVYQTFQAIVSGNGPNGGAVSGTVVGMLFQSNA